MEVLDVGCGTGFWLRALQTSGLDATRLTGVDVVAERVVIASARSPGATVGYADAQALPFDDTRFGVALLFTVLSSLANGSDVHRALSEARRGLRPRGVLLLYEPRMRNPFNPAVRRITNEDLDAAGVTPCTERRLTVFSPLARRLGTRTEVLYPAPCPNDGVADAPTVVYRSDEPL